jgi:hypothetical protein
VLRFLLYAVPLVVTLYALIDAILTAGALARSLPKWLWLVLIVVVPFFGAVAWLLAGRPAREKMPSGGGPLSRVVPRRGAAQDRAPDDDPVFLRKLADDEWTRKMRDRRRGATPDTDEHGTDVP